MLSEQGRASTEMNTVRQCRLLRCISYPQRRHLAGNLASGTGFNFVSHLPLTDPVPTAPGQADAIALRKSAKL